MTAFSETAAHFPFLRDPEILFLQACLQKTLQGEPHHDRRSHHDAGSRADIFECKGGDKCRNKADLVKIIFLAGIRRQDQIYVFFPFFKINGKRMGDSSAAGSRSGPRGFGRVLANIRDAGSVRHRFRGDDHQLLACTARDQSRWPYGPAGTGCAGVAFEYFVCDTSDFADVDECLRRRAADEIGASPNRNGHLKEMAGPDITVYPAEVYSHIRVTDNICDSERKGM